MSKWIVAVTDYGFPNLDEEKKVLEPLGFEFITGQCKNPQEVLRLCRNADAILTQWSPVNAEVIAGLTQCKIIVRYGIGVDNVDLEAANEKRIPVVNVPDYAVEEVADHAMSLLLSSVRKIPQIVMNVRNGIWDIAPCKPIIGLQGKVLGLAGFGNIARAVAKRAQAFGIEVIAYDPYVKAEMFKSLEVRKVDWDILLQDSDFISVHLPLTKETKHLFNTLSFNLMKKSAFLINTSRGGIISTVDLAQALQNERIAGAGLDVLEEEPISINSELLKLENCLITSHCAWYSEASLVKLQLYSALEIKRLFEGERPLHIVNGV
jgi:D-3-phosphoglycerate dehydrogenase